MAIAVSFKNAQKVTNLETIGRYNSQLTALLKYHCINYLYKFENHE